MPKNKNSKLTKKGGPVDDGTSSRSRKRLATDDEQPSTSTSAPQTQKRSRLLTDQEICYNLMVESDDDCSIFDDDIGDADFAIESDHNTDTDQSEDENESIVDPLTNEIRQVISPHEEPQTIDIEPNVDPDERTEFDSDGDELSMNRPRFYYGKNRYKWSSNEPSARTTRVRSHNIINVEAQVSPTEFVSFEDIWKLLFTENMIELIVTHTNEKLIKCRSKFKDSTRSELVPTNTIEIKSLLGLLFYTSVFHSNHENADYIFATDGTGREVFRCVMSKNRFLQLVNCLRFDDALTRTERLKNDKLAAISELFQAFISNCKKNYTLGTHVCIDEMLVGFRGRCHFRIYMPNKPNKYGLKIMTLVDANSFYFYDAYIYSGKGSDSESLTAAEKRLSVPAQSVIRLSKDIVGSNRNITADNWFSSIELMQELKNRGLTYVGTLKKNKREIPPEFLPSKDRDIGSTMYGYNKDFTILSQQTKPNKVVLVISSMHHSEETDSITNKPAMIVDYNKTKGGVDEVDKKCSIYSCSRRTRRWPMTLFYRLLDLSGVNAFILHNNCTNLTITKDITRGRFILSLARELVLPAMKLRVYNDRIPRELRYTIERVIGPSSMPGPPAPTEHQTPDPGVRKTCAVCPSRLRRRTKYFCFKCSKPICLTCCTQVCNECKKK